MMNVSLGLLVASLGSLKAHAENMITFTAQQDGVRMYEVVESQDSATKKFNEVKAPWKIEVNSSKLFVFEKPGFIPVYLPVFQTPSHNTEIKINLKKLDGETRVQATLPTLAMADDLMDEILAVQHLLDQRKYAQGLVQAEQLYSTHSRSSAVRLVYANALVLNKQIGRADQVYASIQEEINESKPAFLETIKQVRSRLRAPAAVKTGEKQ